MTNKPMLSVERELLESAVECLERCQDQAFQSCECEQCLECGKMPDGCSGTECAKTCQCSTCEHCSNEQAIKELRALLDQPACTTPSGKTCPGDGVGACKKCPTAQHQGEPVALTVWEGAMPESNGRSNFTVILHTGDLTEGICVYRSEYPDRARYEADCFRHLIGDPAFQEKPFICDYDTDKHSGYVKPDTSQPEPVACNHEWTDDGEHLLVCTACGAQEDHSPGWRDMSTAPRDGTMLRLLVEFEEHPTEDEDQAPTIGSNNFDNDDVDEWKFSGWCWTHDHFTEGKGTPIGWLPMLDGPKVTQGAERPAPVAVVLPDHIQGYPAQSNHRSYNEGWNACLTKVARLNGVKP